MADAPREGARVLRRQRRMRERVLGVGPLDPAPGDARPASGETQRWLAGPYWNMLLITYVYIALTTALTFFLVATFTEFPYFFVLGMALAIVSLVALSLTAFRDPGIFPSHSRPIGPHWSYSNQAQSFRPPNVIYCRECKLLIEDYENFCPWVGTVIAKNNSNSMKVFVASFVCLMAICTAALSCSIAQAGATATSAKGLLVLPLIGIFIVLVGVVMRTARPPRKTPAERVRARATAAAVQLQPRSAPSERRC